MNGQRILSNFPIEIIRLSEIDGESTRNYLCAWHSFWVCKLVFDGCVLHDNPMQFENLIVPRYLRFAPLQQYQ
jgi:hypothetical protein